MNLCQKSSDLNLLLNHELLLMTKCFKCSKKNVIECIQNNIYNVFLPQAKICTLQEIIEFNANCWMDTDVLCEKKNCLGKLKENVFLSTTNSVLLIQLPL